MDIPPQVQKLLDKNKIVEETSTDVDHVYWFKDPEIYEIPERINVICDGWEMHLGKRGPYLVRFVKDSLMLFNPTFKEDYGSSSDIREIFLKNSPNQ